MWWKYTSWQHTTNEIMSKAAPRRKDKLMHGRHIGNVFGSLFFLFLRYFFFLSLLCTTVWCVRTERRGKTNELRRMDCCTHSSHIFGSTTADRVIHTSLRARDQFCARVYVWLWVCDGRRHTWYVNCAEENNKVIRSSSDWMKIRTTCTVKWSSHQSVH